MVCHDPAPLNTLCYIFDCETAPSTSTPTDRRILGSGQMCFCLGLMM